MGNFLFGMFLLEKTEQHSTSSTSRELPGFVTASEIRKRKLHMQEVQFTSCPDIVGSPVAANHDSDVHEQRHKHVTKYRWNHTISHPESSLAFENFHRETAKQQGIQSGHQPKWPHTQSTQVQSWLTWDFRRQTERKTSSPCQWNNSAQSVSSRQRQLIWSTFCFTSPQKKDKTWHKLPDRCNDSALNTLEIRIYDDVVKFKTQEKLNPTTSNDQREMFLFWIKWNNSQLSKNEKQRTEQLLVKYHQVFERHRLNVCINTEFIDKSLPKPNNPIYVQTLPTPANMKDEVLVKLDLIQIYDVIKTSLFSKYSSPIFAQRKPNGKLGFCSRPEKDSPKS